MSTISTPRGPRTRAATTEQLPVDGTATVPGVAPLDGPAMRLSEVARRLSISRAGAYRLIRSGQLRAIQVGQTWRVLRADFEAYLDEQRADAERRYRHARGEG